MPNIPKWLDVTTWRQRTDVQDGYKGLGLIQENSKYEEEAWMAATAKYLKEETQILFCQLNGKYMIQEINIYCMPCQ